MAIRAYVQVLVDDVLHDHGLGRGTRLSAALVEAVLFALRDALHETAPGLVADIVQGTDLSTRVEAIGLPVRTMNCLGRERVYTLRDVLARSALPEVEGSMHGFRNFPPWCVAEVLRRMESLGVPHPDLAAAQSSDWWPQEC